MWADDSETKVLYVQDARADDPAAVPRHSSWPRRPLPWSSRS